MTTAAGAGTGAGAAGTGTGTGTGTGAGAGTGTGTGAGAGTEAPWHGYTDVADVAWVANKGWQGPADAVRSAREAEKLIGRDPNTLLVLPRADDPAGLRSVLGKLGLPEKPEAYELDAPKGTKADDPFSTWARGAFHKTGLLPGQAKELSAEYNAFVKAHAEKATKDYETSVASDKQALLSEWKGGHERMMNVATAATKALGFTPEMVDAIETQVGYAATMKFFAGLGMKMSEDTLQLSGVTSQKFGEMQTPDEAKATWETKKMDTNFMNALKDPKHPGHTNAQAEQTRLFKIMYPEG